MAWLRGGSDSGMLLRVAYRGLSGEGPTNAVSQTLSTLGCIIGAPAQGLQRRNQRTPGRFGG